MDVHGSTYYALVWNQKPEITLHAVDQAGNELIPSTTTEISEETDVNTLAANVEGSALTSVTADHTNITEVKADKGKLYFNNGQDWTEASDTNVFFIYAPLQVTEDTTDVPVPEEPSVQEEETVTQPETKQLTKTTKDKKYTVTITYGDDAGLPEGTDLSLKTINTDDEKYADAKKAVASNKNVDASTLGMEALDITLTDSSHNEVEPDPESNVQVSISINDLPDNIDSVDIHHITEEDTSNTVIKGIKRIGRIFNKDISVNNDKSSAVAENVHVINNTANAVFKTSSFSIYTITWKKSNVDRTRVGSIRVHYVNETGADMANATSVPSSDLVAGSEVALADWANDDHGNTRLTGYTFKEARLETYQSDKKVSKIKVVAETNTYVLQYQPEGSNDWVTYSDSVSKQNVNNVEVYLVFTQNPTLKLHYVDENGTDLNGGTTDSKTADEILNDAGISVSTWSSSKTFTGYTPRDNSMAHLGGINGSEVTDVRSVKNADGSFTMQYKAGSNDNWKALTSNDIYLEYSKDRFTKEVEVYYTDIAGKPIKDASGNDIVKKYDAADWTNGSHSFVNDATSYTPEGYVAFDKNNFIADDYPNWWKESDLTKNTNNRGNRIIYKTDNFIPNANNNSTFGVEIFRDVRGYAIDTMLYSGDSIQIKRPNNREVTLPGTEKSPYKVYIMYKKQLTIHDIDANGNELGSRTSNNWYVGYDPKGWNSTYSYGTSASNTVITANTTYGTPIKIYIQSANNKEISSQSISNFQIAWQFNGAATYNDINTTQNQTSFGTVKESSKENVSNGKGKWITRIRTGNGNSDNDYQQLDNQLITDVYVQYAYSSLPVTIHHIDNNGNAIAKDSTETISTDKTITPSISTDYAINGYTLAGGKVDMTAGSSAETFTGGTDFYSYTVDKSGSTFAPTYKTSAEASDASPTNQNEIWLVYAKNKTVTIHYIDTDGGKLQNDTTKTVSGANTIITPSTDADTITNFDRSYGKIGMVKGSNGNVSDGTQFFSISFKPNQYGTWGSTYKTENGGSDTDVSVPNELWYVYTPNTNGQVKIHFVDTDGNVIGDPYVSERKVEQYTGDKWIGADFLTWLDITGSPGYQQINKSEYSFKGEYIGPSFNTDAHKLVRNTTTAKVWVQWKYDNGNWYTSHSTSGDGTDHPAGDKTKFNGLITDFYWVFDKTEMNVHYVYMDLSSDETNTKLTKIKDDQTINSVGTSVDDATTIDAGNNDNTSLVPLTITSNNKSYQYAGTRIGPSFVANTTVYGDLGPDAKKVYSADGQLMYYNSSTVPLNYLRRNTWYADTNSGRRYILNRSGDVDAYSYSLNDSSHGDVALNYVSPDTYTASFHGENGTTQYKLTIGENNYQLAVTEWQPSGLTDVYEIYTQGTQNKIWIEDDQKYSGYLIANISSALQQEGAATNKTYTWYKTVTNSAGVTTTTQVSRQLTGQNYNIEYNPANRTWLNVEADEGGLNDTDQTSVQYYVELNYKDNRGQPQTLRSNKISIQYYSQLENGGFETPVEYIVSEPKTSSSIKNGYNGNQNTDVGFGKAPGGNGQISNADYKAAGGVWQTTGTGPGPNKLNRDIEIFNVNMGNTGVADSWATSPTSGDKVTPTAADGVQFAELNCEAAGALYQDTVTHPNEQLNYRFSHRARATKKFNQVFDSMYLVIMPTKLAMTGSSIGGELKTQDELEAWLKDHGGYDKEKATAKEEKITYQDFDNGILVVKVSSDNYDWHSINVVNGYIAKSGLTRFFFVSGQTSSGNNTTGNFIDGISFTQELPTTQGINLQVNKTFSGLSDLQLASLAGNASTANIEGLKTDETPFTFTVSNRHYDRQSNKDDNLANAALQNATLGFDVSGSADSITFTPTATLNGVNQFTGNSKGGVTRNADGSITMTWTFLDLPLRNTDGTISTDQDYYYKVTENNSGIMGYSVTPSESIRVRKKDGSSISSTEEADLSQGDSATFNVDNSYKDNSMSDQPQIVVTKKFTGVTPSSVDEMLGSGYRLKITKTSKTSNNTLILQGNTVTPVVRSVNDPEEIQNLDVSLTMDTVDSSKDGSITLTWLIKGWGEGTYTMEEEGFNTSNNSLSKVTVNDEPVDISSDTTTIGKEGLVVGGATATPLEYGDMKQESAAAGGSLKTPSNDNQPVKNTNLIIAQYTLYGKTNYEIWTPEALGANTRQAIVNKIKDVWPDSSATMSNTDFHSSANPGKIDVKSGSGETFGSLTYDSTSHQIQFEREPGRESNLTWDRYYSAIYHVAGKEGVYNEPDIRVVNSYVPAVRVRKVSSGEEQKPLAGAKFELYKYDGTTKQYLVNSASNSNWAANDTHITFTTNSDGIATTGEGKNSSQIINSLKNGIYYLEETKAPPGYNLPAKNIVAIKVDENGVVSQITSDTDVAKLPEVERSKINTKNDGDEGITIDWNSAYYTITVRNKPGILLPITGGRGIVLFTIAGMLLICIGTVLIVKKKLDQEAGDHS
ncbi:MAG: SpaA isopeptide-forming pilin-related protein [Erysipelotrichaceae bacterium]|nr:SpaA isopeptide-forming pilin-related protein [Erysipelotrichaceae bacterium]